MIQIAFILRFTLRLHPRSCLLVLKRLFTANLHPDECFSSGSELNFLSIVKGLKTHITRPFKYTWLMCARINKKQIAYSAGCCLVADHSNNSLPPARVGSCSIKKLQNELHNSYEQRQQGQQHLYFIIHAAFTTGC